VVVKTSDAVRLIKHDWIDRRLGGGGSAYVAAFTCWPAYSQRYDSSRCLQAPC